MMSVVFPDSSKIRFYTKHSLAMNVCNYQMEIVGTSFMETSETDLYICFQPSGIDEATRNIAFATSMLHKSLCAKRILILHPIQNTLWEVKGSEGERFVRAALARKVSIPLCHVEWGPAPPKKKKWYSNEKKRNNPTIKTKETSTQHHL